MLFRTSAFYGSAVYLTSHVGLFSPLFFFYQLVFADTILVYVIPLVLSPIIMINCEQKLITGTSEMALLHATSMGLNWNPLVCF